MVGHQISIAFYVRVVFHAMFGRLAKHCVDEPQVWPGPLRDPSKFARSGQSLMEFRQVCPLWTGSYSPLTWDKGTRLITWGPLGRGLLSRASCGLRCDL